MKRILLFLFTSLTAIYSQAQSPKKFNSRLESVTVYSKGAELNHSSKVTLPAGISEITLGNIANLIDENSIQISVPSNVTILSTSFTRDFLRNENNSPAYIKVEDSLQLVKRALNKLENKRIVEENQIILLDKNQTIGGSNSGVNVTELIKVVDYYKNKQLELRNNIVTLKEAEALQQKKIVQMEKQLQELSQDKSGTAGQIVLQLMANAACSADLNVSYFSPSATWIAFYDLRAENTTSPLKIIYKANVSQSTGLDWKKVKLSLSSGNPTQNGTAPLLSTWFLQFGEPEHAYRAQKELYQNRIQGISSTASLSKAELSEVTMPESKVNGLVVQQNENMLNTTFDIEIPYDIASNSKPHIL